jgi:hypothetical protein
MCCFMPALLEAAPRGTSALQRSQTAIPSQLRSVYTLKYCHHLDVHPSGFFTGHRLRSSSQARTITAVGSAAAAAPLMAIAHDRTECRENGGKNSFETVNVQPLDRLRIYLSRYMLTRSVIASNSALGYTDITEQITEIPSGISRSAI